MQSIKVRLGRLISACTPTVELVRQSVQPDISKPFSCAHLCSTLDACSETLLNLEDFLIPAYADTGKRYTHSECVAIATQLATTIGERLAVLLQHLLASLCYREGEMTFTEHKDVAKFFWAAGGRGLTSQPTATAFCVRICTILRRILLIHRFEHQYVTPSRPDYIPMVATTHEAETFPACCAIYSSCTDRMQLLSPDHPRHLSSPEDRQQVLLCGAVLGSALSEFCYAAYGDLRWSSAIPEEFADRTHITDDTWPSKLQVWAQLQQTCCRICITEATRHLTSAAQAGSFYNGLSPLYRGLLTPGLGLESLAMLQLSLWVADTRLGDLDPEISSVVEGPLSLLRSTLEASAGSITHPNPTDPHLTPLLNTSLYATAHLWVSEGRVSPGFRELNGPPMLRRCLGVMAAVAEGEQAGRRTDAPPRSARGLWGSLDSSVGPPSVALDVLSALHTLIGDEHVISKGAGDALHQLPQHLAAWEYCLRVGIQIMAPREDLTCLVPAFSCAAAPLAVLWGSPELTSHAPVRTLLRVWKLQLRCIEKSLRKPVGPQQPEASITATFPVSAAGHPALKVLRHIVIGADLFPSTSAHDSPNRRYCSASTAARLAAATWHTARLQGRLLEALRGFTPPCVRLLHSTLRMLRTVVTHHTQYIVSYATQSSGDLLAADLRQAGLHSGGDDSEYASSHGSGSSGTSSSVCAEPVPVTGRTTAEPMSAAAADGGPAWAHSQLAVAQLLPTGLSLVRAALSVSLLSMARGDANHMLTDVLLPTAELIELLLDIKEWPEGDDSSSCVGVGGSTASRLSAREFVTWEDIALATRAVQMCWTLALSANARFASANGSHFSALLHDVTRQLLKLLQHRFQDNTLADNVRGGPVELLLQEMAQLGGNKDSSALLAVVAKLVRMAGTGSLSTSNNSNSCSSHRETPSGAAAEAAAAAAAELASTSTPSAAAAGGTATRFCPDDPDYTRCANGFDDICLLFESGVLLALDGLTRSAGMPLAVCKELTCVQVRMLTWLRAALIPACVVGPGLGSWRKSFAARSKEAKKGHVPSSVPGGPSRPDVEKSTIQGTIHGSTPLFAQLADVLLQASTRQSPSPSFAASARAAVQVPRLLSGALWLEAYHAMCHLLAHARISMADCLMEGMLSTATATLARVVSRLPVAVRLEVACAQKGVREVRVGCCYLDCKVVDRKASHGEAGVQLLRCSQCAAVEYCCRACQKAGWAEHKPVCHLLMQERS